ncbi:hypothetical protein HID58_060942 [Brassica napus]|uniref:CASP-like protein n=1 Tax=Brassica napus TaxID=3708 RepID=A0ABQ7ZX70_BRANA|nr:hypothetical protein HID58_060942 [Brassica napus]
MRSPHAVRNGESPSSRDLTHFHSIVAAQKLRRFNSLLLLLRLASFSFSFSLASAVFMLTNSHGSGSPHWYDFDAFRSEIAFLFTNSRSWQTRSWRYIRSSKWELAFGSFPEKQRYGLKRFKYGSTLVTTRYVFSYLLLSAGSAAAALARSNDEGR